MDPSLYSSPTYFPPSYFYDRSDDLPDPGRPEGPYDAPSYFPTAYFYAASSPSGPTVGPPPPQVVAPTPTRQDAAAFAAIVGLLQGTGGFGEVTFGVATRGAKLGSGAHPMAVVAPSGWEESDESDPTLLLRRVAFTIRVVVLADDESAPFDRLDQLSTAVQKAVDRSDLGGTCLAPLTRIRSGRFDDSARYPEWSVLLEGEFTSIVDPATELVATPY